MNRTFAVSFLACTFAFATGASAQTPPSYGGDAGKDDKGKQHSMTVTGCLSEAPGASGEFLLTKTPAGTAAPSGADSKSMASTYRLVGDGKVSLKDHVGHKVEITGKMAGHEHETPSGSTDRPSETAKEPKINVTSLKHIAGTCEAESRQ
jgi:hypothetical protein